MKTLTGITWCRGSTLGKSSGKSSSCSGYLPWSLLVDCSKQIFQIQPIAQTGHITSSSAVPKAYYDFAPGPDLLCQFEVVSVGYRPLHQDHIDSFRQLFYICQRAVNEFSRLLPARSSKRSSRSKKLIWQPEQPPKPGSC